MFAHIIGMNYLIEDVREAYRRMTILENMHKELDGKVLLSFGNDHSKHKSLVGTEDHVQNILE
jgi:hypothetical protein